jgi:predicted permease
VSRFHGIRRALRIPRFTRHYIAREVDEELSFHIEKRAEALRATGWPDSEARAEAKRRFGTLDELRAECIEVEITEQRRERIMDFADQLASDIRFAARSLRKAPGFSLVALVTLVLGIASVTSIFSFFNAVYYGTLPYGNPRRTVALSENRGPGSRADYSIVSLDALGLLRQPLRSFERVSAYDVNYRIISSGSDPKQIGTLAIDTSFIPLFDLRPEAGRLIAPEEIANGARVTMISDVLWRSQFGQSPGVIGRMITMDLTSYQIIGVMPPGFRFPYQTDALVPLREIADSGATTANTFVSVVAKLRPGATRNDARAEIAVVASHLPAIDAKIYRNATLVVRDEMLDRRAQQFLPLPSVFLGAGFFLLVIACSNVTNLFYVRAAQRRGEMAIRASLGARRGRLIRHALAESLLISTVAAVLGTVLALWLVKLWLHFVPTQGFPSWFHVAIDLRVLAFAVGVTALVTIVVGLSPAREGTRFDLVRALKGDADGGSSSSRVTRGSRRGLVVQLGLSMALFISAALLARSFQKLTSIDLGYPAERIATVQPLFDRVLHGDLTRTMSFVTNIAERAARMPGVTGTAVRGEFAQLRDVPNAKTPRTARSFERYDSRLIPDGDSTRAVRPRMPAMSYVVSDGYFDLLGLRLHSGRHFSGADGGGAPPVAIVGAYTAKLLWGDTSPVGRTIQLGRFGDVLTVIGVVDDMKEFRGGSRGYSAEAGPMVYLTTRQALSYRPEILARGSGNVVEMRGRIVDLVRAEDPMLILLRDVTLASRLDAAFLEMKVFGGVIAALAAAALALSVIGIYGVVAFGITQRTRELGIRIALGGTVDDIMKLILGETLRFVTIGLVVGLLLALGFGRLLKAFLFGVSPIDPLAYVLVALLFGGVALVASWWPARRVSRIDPLAALRAD